MGLGHAFSEYVERARKREEEIRGRKRLRDVEGYPFWPHETIRNVVIISMFSAVMLYFSAFLPFFLEHPADPAGQPQFIFPDWYLLWSYGLLKIAKELPLPTILTPVMEQIDKLGTGFGGPCVGNPEQWCLTGLEVGTLLNAVFVVPLFLIPFIDRNPKQQRPVEKPFWAALGFAASVEVFLQSVYSINGIVYNRWPIYAATTFPRLLFVLLAVLAVLWLVLWKLERRFTGKPGPMTALLLFTYLLALPAFTGFAAGAAGMVFGLALSAGAASTIGLVAAVVVDIALLFALLAIGRDAEQRASATTFLVLLLAPATLGLITLTLRVRKGLYEVLPFLEQGVHIPPGYDLLAWITWLAPIPFGVATYWILKAFKDEHGYEANLSATYYRVR